MANRHAVGGCASKNHQRTTDVRAPTVWDLFMPQHMSVGRSLNSLLLKSYFLPYHLTEQWRHHNHHTWQQHLATSQHTTCCT